MASDPFTQGPLHGASENIIQNLVQKNHEWAKHQAETNGDLLKALSTKQAPKILWIGCSDSRVPETTICNANPGDLFVHRNIANIVHAGDINCGAVVDYAVNHLGVKHIVVCGHSGCGGVSTALGNKTVGLIDTWLIPIRTLRVKFAAELKGASEVEAMTKVVEENVRLSVETLKQNPSVIRGIKHHHLEVHGLVYHIDSGKLEIVDTAEDDAIRAERIHSFDTGYKDGHAAH